MSYDVAALRARFPALAEGAAHFDGPGGSQVPDSVGIAVGGALVSAIANRGRLTAAERRADEIVEEARKAAADLLGGDADGVVFGRSMTSLTYEISRAFAKDWGPGDEVVVTRLDHDANIRPWVQAAGSAGAVVRWADFDPATGELPVDAVASQISGRTRLVAVSGASNLIGTRPDVAEISSAAHQVGAMVYVDGVHLTAHTPVDVTDLGADFYACSSYKWMGPHCGLVAADPTLLQRLHPDKLLPSTDAVPERFELGTLPYELLAGVTAAVDFIAGIGELVGDEASQAVGGARRDRVLASMSAVEDHEDRLRRNLEESLDGMGSVVRHSRAARRTPTLLLTFDHHAPGQVAAALADMGVNAPAGSFYAIEASHHLGLGDAGGLRVGLAPYSDQNDIDRLVSGLQAVLNRT
jgi:cysteine desulfurase family protein (TIGR01976 family)